MGDDDDMAPQLQHTANSPAGPELAAGERHLAIIDRHGKQLATEGDALELSLQAAKMVLAQPTRHEASQVLSAALRICMARLAPNDSADFLELETAADAAADDADAATSRRSGRAVKRRREFDDEPALRIDRDPTDHVVCPVCAGPGRCSSTQLCSTCYSGLYNDLHRIVRRSIKSPTPLRLLGSQEHDLKEFERVFRVLMPCTRNFTCQKSDFVYSIDTRSRCHRCRTLYTISLFPELAHSILSRAGSTVTQGAPRMSHQPPQNHMAIVRAAAASAAQLLDPSQPPPPAALGQAPQGGGAMHSGMLPTALEQFAEIAGQRQFQPVASAMASTTTAAQGSLATPSMLQALMPGQNAMTNPFLAVNPFLFGLPNFSAMAPAVSTLGSTGMNPSVMTSAVASAASAAAAAAMGSDE
eukprot:m.275663 g.275663  ORF g.275663 m.275663 type:complete len:414 (+) comp11096_c1_seq10:210-1451(+)